jgi:hypothetical protein
MYYNRGALPIPATVGDVQNILGVLYSACSFLGNVNAMTGMPYFSSDRVVSVSGAAPVTCVPDDTWCVWGSQRRCVSSARASVSGRPCSNHACMSHSTALHNATVTPPIMHAPLNLYSLGFPASLHTQGVPPSVL